MSATHPLRIGLLGCGVVGSPVARAIIDDPHYELAAVAVRNPAKRRAVTLAPGLLSSDPLAIADDPLIDIVVEVMGGIEPARSAILSALRSGKPVVTANKELLAVHGREIFAAAHSSGVSLFLEASVGGAIPIVRVLQTSLQGDRVLKVTGILNGTTNCILSRMHETGADLQEALRHAQARGYAEADPIADLEGFDAAAKVAILARLAFGVDAHLDDVRREGITGVSQGDVALAAECGHVLKLVGSAERTATGCDLRVGLELVRVDDPLASVSGATNAIFIETARAGVLRLTGQGAGGLPTSSAVLGDLAAAASIRHRRSSRASELRSAAQLHLATCPTCRQRSRHEPAAR